MPLKRESSKQPQRRLPKKLKTYGQGTYEAFIKPEPPGQRKKMKPMEPYSTIVAGGAMRKLPGGGFASVPISPRPGEKRRQPIGKRRRRI